MNISKLRGKIVENGLTQDELAKRINIDRSTLSRRMKTGESFTVGEASKITAVLNLSKDEAVEIFLPNVSQ